jgi:hypothetical protein
LWISQESTSSCPVSSAKDVRFARRSVVTLQRRGGGEGRVVERVEERERARQFLPGDVGADIEPGLDPRRDAEPDIAVDLGVILVLVRAKPILVRLRGIEQDVDVALDPRHLDVGAERPERAALDAHEGRRDRGIGGGRDEIHSPAKRRGSEDQRVAALVHLHRTRRERVDLVIIA